ncbi:MAG: hypothetical protein J5U19_02615 [Candidatus Methanoperedens sp.]|nr:hypothetical protein [Candidatus Methanoperedens sp.]
MSLFDARFFDLITHCSNPDSIKKMAFQAKQSGYSGIGILNPSSDISKIDIPDDFSLFSSIEMACKPSAFRDEIRKNKGKKNILIVKGKDEDLDRIAVETEGLDILMQPARINNIMAKIAADNSVAIGFNIGSIIRNRGDSRARDLTIMRTNLMHARKYGTQIILTSDSHSPYDIRAPGEIVALSAIFGMTPKEAVIAMSAMPLDIMKKKNFDYLQEGIEIL